jgi:ATP phosphoribosyltransferase regulatory subunit
MNDLKSYPTGVRALLIDETARRRRIESRFTARLERDGFAEVVLPIIDYVEPYARLTDRQVARQSYRFVDREGELVSIRSDFTPMIARALAPSLTAGDLPLRVFYRGDVIRCEQTRLGANRELFQIGAEIIGDSSVEAEIELLRLAVSLVAEFGIRPLIVYNDVSIVEKLIASIAPDATIEGAIRAALIAKRTAALDTVRDLIAPATFTLIERLVQGSATLDELRACEVTAAAAERLAAIEIATAGIEEASFILHLDDIDASSSYYTGLRFRIYSADARTTIAQGGRYDELYQRFGMSAAAAGFTFTIDDLDGADLGAVTQPAAAQEVAR